MADEQAPQKHAKKLCPKVRHCNKEKKYEII